MKKLLFAVAVIGCALQAVAQEQSTIQEGEIGITAGAAHYFGDLNPSLRLNRPKLAFGLFARKQFGNYVALRVSGHFAQLGYSDIYNGYNVFMHTRNLSFNTNIWELAVQGDFNFFKFVPGNIDIVYNFTSERAYAVPRSTHFES